MADSKRICSIQGCEKKAYRRKMCLHHYQAWLAARPTGARYTRNNSAPKTCTVAGCDLPHVGKGYCSKHYHRLIRHGDPLYESRAAPGDHMTWLSAHVDFDGDGCLRWPFKAANVRGYGVTRMPGGRQKNASNIMCELAHGEPPTPLHEAAHSCGKGHEGCVNPKHLRWATRSENHADKHLHGTAGCGENNYGAKLTEDQVLKIRASDLPANDLAGQYGISANYVYQIKGRHRWRHLA